MRVVFLRANPIDPDPRVEKEAEALINAGHSCILVGWDRLSNHEPIYVSRSVGNVPVKTVLIGVRASFGQGAKNAPNVARFEKRLLKWLLTNADDYDVIHSCDLDTGLAARSAALKLKKPLVYDIFDFYADSRIMPNWLKTAVRKTEFMVIKAARAVIICSEQRKVQIDGSQYKEIVVIENTPREIEAVSGSKTLRNNASNRIDLAYVGILTEDRYLDRLLDVVDSNEDLCLTIGGFGPLSDEVEARSKANSRIIYKGKMAYQDALACEKNADVMFGMYNPSVANNRLAAPNKYYESLMLGTPLITVRGTSVADWVEADCTGEALDCDFRPDDLYQAIRRIVTANANGGLSRTGRRLYEEMHSWGIMEDRLQTLYADIEAEILTVD